MYHYKCTIFKNPQVLGLPNGTHAPDITDFETNFKGQGTQISDIILAETTYVTDLSYRGFKGKIDGVNVTWANVKYINDSAKYILNLLSGNPI